MKTVTTTSPCESVPIQVLQRRLRDKLRRDRINNSLATLQLLLLEKTHNERLLNPRMQKAEILESLVNFLSDQVMEMRDQKRTGVLSRGSQQGYSEDTMTWGFRGGMMPQVYREGIVSQGHIEDVASQSHEDMTSCLLRVRHIVTNWNQEASGSWLEKGSSDASSMMPHAIQLHGAVMGPSTCGPVSGQRQHAWSSTSQHNVSPYSATSTGSLLSTKDLDQHPLMDHSERSYAKTLGYHDTPFSTANHGHH